MKKTANRKPFFVFSILLAVSSFSTAIFAQEKFDVKNTEAILISVAMPEIHNAPKPKGDEALFITDKAEIAKFVKLFDGNSYAVSHACGYHWQITFIKKDSAAPTDIWFNQNCEEFERNTTEICETVQAKFKQAKEKPTHFITEIGIDASVSPDEAIKELKETGKYNVFALGDTDKRFPYIEIEASATTVLSENRELWNKENEKTRQKADALLFEEAKTIAQNFPVLKTGETEFVMSGSSREYTEKRSLKIYFPVGTKLDGIEKNLTNAKLKAKSEPEIYFLQLVSPIGFSKSFAARLSAEFPFIKQTFAYTAYPR